MSYEPFKAFLKYAVKAENLQDFIDRYHKAMPNVPRRVDYEDHKRELEINGFTYIPPRYSTTGEIVSYYGRV